MKNNILQNNENFDILILAFLGKRDASLTAPNQYFEVVPA